MFFFFKKENPLSIDTLALIVRFCTEISPFDFFVHRPIDQFSNSEVNQPDKAYAEGGEKKRQPDTESVDDIEQKQCGERYGQEACPDFENSDGLD